MRDRSRFAYAFGRIRSVENRLLAKSDFIHLAEAKGAEEAYRLLGETDYGSLVRKYPNPWAYENVLADEQDRVVEFLKAILPEEGLLPLLSLPFDFLNLKMLTKARELTNLPEDSWAYGGNYSREDIAKIVDGRDGGELSRLVQPALAAWEKTRDPVLLDTMLDGIMYEHLISAAALAGYPFLVRYYRAALDLANIRTLFRVKKSGQTRDFLSKVLLAGGELSPSLFVEALAEEPAVWAKQFAHTPYGAVVKEILGLASRKSPEKIVDDYLMNLLKRTKSATLSPEVAIGYYFAKQAEIKNLRLVMVGKLNNLPAEFIIERLRDTYA